MTKTLLIVIGIACALVTAAGIMYNHPVYAARRNLTAKNPEVLSDAIWTLYGHRDRQSYPQIRQFLRDDEDILVLISSLMYLGSPDFKESAPEVRNMLNHKNEGIRRLAIAALEYMGDKESIPDIRKRLNDKNDRVRSRTIMALVKFEDKESSPEIRELLTDKDGYVRYEAIDALVKLGDKDSIPAIKELLTDEDVCRYAEKALKKLGVSEEEIEKATGK